jgi:hypothetical protein
MPVPRFARAIAVFALCVGGAVVGVAPAAQAADNNPVQTIFFGRELLAFQCITHGGTYWESGTGYGCHLANGAGDVWCDNGVCTWYQNVRPANPRDRVVLTAGVLQQVSGADPIPGEPVDGRQLVLSLDAAPTLTVEQVQALTGRALADRARAGIGAVSRVLTVRADETLSAEQLDGLLGGLLAGKETKGVELLDTLTDPKPETPVGGAAARMKVPGQRILVIHGEIYVDGVSTPVLIIIVIVH